MSDPRHPTTAPPRSRERLRDVRSLTAVVAALATCRHPSDAHVGRELVILGEPTPVTWCAVCGAMASSDPAAGWGRPALLSLLTADMLSPLAAFLHVAAELSEGSEEPGRARTLEELARLGRSTLAADVYQLDDAIALLAPATRQDP